MLYSEKLFCKSSWKYSYTFGLRRLANLGSSVYSNNPKNNVLSNPSFLCFNETLLYLLSVAAMSRSALLCFTFNRSFSNFKWVSLIRISSWK
jgi:hypothetical protein